jgi:histidine racemase
MFTSKVGEQLIKIEPIVYVRDINTLFYETACGSGSTAVALVESLKTKNNKTELDVLQPSGKLISVKVLINKGKFIYAEIDGEVEIVKNGEA